MGRSDAFAVEAGDSVSNLDYSGGRKTHRFPPPYGLGSLSLTIASNRSDDRINPLRDTPHPNLPQSGEGAFCRFPLNLGRGGQDTLPNSGRARVGSNYYFVIPGCDPESHNWANYKGRNNLKPSVFAGDSGSWAGVTPKRVLQGILNHAPLFRMTTKKLTGYSPSQPSPSQG